RLLLRDDEAQAQRARDLVDSHANSDGSLFVSDVVLAEFALVLKSRYALSGKDITLALRALLDNATLAWQSRSAAVTALRLFENGGVDFPDCLVTALASAHGCDNIATFDQGMRHLPQVQLL
ncbi:MAG: PIN domain-containing protein, partial [Rhodocyclaceae bacterium]|nr:PIN domain-containing protein [Rhodocyclaceae bacterium]